MRKSKISVSILAILKYLRDNKRATADELKGAVTKKNISGSTYYRALEELKNIDVVVKQENGYYTWYDYDKIRKYNHVTNYKQALEHSKILCKALDKLTKNYEVYDDEYLEYALVHLEDESPATYEIYKMMNSHQKNRRGKISKVYDSFYASNLVGLYGMDKKVIKSVFHDIVKNMLEFDSDIQDIIKKQISLHYNSRDYEVDYLTQDICVFLNDNINRNRIQEIINLNSQYRSKRKIVNKDIKKIIKKVNNGTPLGGKCDLCPQILIKNINEYNDFSGKEDR